MGGADMDFFGTVGFGDMGRTHYAARRGNHIVKNENNLPLKGGPDQVGLAGFRGTGASFIHDGDGSPKLFLES